MNSVQLKSLIALVFSSLEEFATNQQKADQLGNEAKLFFDQNAKNTAKEGEIGDWKLNKRDQGIYDKKIKELDSLADQKGVLKNFFDGIEDLQKNPKLSDAKHTIKSSYTPSELADFINEMETKETVLGVKYFTGTNDGDIVYCAAVEYLKAK